MNKRLHWVLILLALTVTAPAVWGQGVSGSSSPSEPSGGPLESVTGTSQSPSSPPLQADTHPLAGAYLFTLGSAFEGHSYFQPEFSLFEVGQTNAETFLPGSSKSLETATMPTADLSLLHVSRTNKLFASYLGGGIIYNNVPSASSAFHMVNLGDTIQFRRLNLSFSDFFTYLPNASYGFGGFGLPGGVGAGYTGGFGFAGGFGQINPAFASTSSILTNPYSVFNNTAVAQAAYAASARTSVTVAGMYGILQGGGNKTGFINGNNIYGMAGVSHALTARDNIGVSYIYGTFHYLGLPESFNVQMAQFSYGRKITGRLGLQLYGGPELMKYHTPGQGVRSQVYGTGSGALSYQQDRNTFTIYGGRYSNGGSGLLAGAETTMVSGSWTRSLTRNWSGSVYGGYSRSSAAVVAANATGQHYAYWFGNVMLSRILNRYLSLYISYQYERQTNNAGRCTEAVCAVYGAHQLFGVGISFTPRPVGL